MTHFNILAKKEEEYDKPEIETSHIQARVRKRWTFLLDG